MQRRQAVDIVGASATSYDDISYDNAKAKGPGVSRIVLGVGLVVAVTVLYLAVGGGPPGYANRNKVKADDLVEEVAVSALCMRCDSSFVCHLLVCH